jgi:chromosome segregation ATPase
MQTPYDDKIASLCADLDSIAFEDASSVIQRNDRAVGETLQSLQEDVAAARGRLQACREHDLDTTAAQQELEAAIRRLSERHTSATATIQQRDRNREHARKRRDRHERKLRLEDQIANLERQARRSLVDRLAGEFAEAVDQVPGTATPPDPFAASPPVTALAIARLAAIDAPLVLACDRFDSAVAAHDWLDAPLIEI